MRSATTSSPTTADLLGLPEEKKLQYTTAMDQRVQDAAPGGAQRPYTCMLVVANGAFYTGNVFAFKSSVDQSLRKFVMATLIWVEISYAVVLTPTHVPSFMAESAPRFAQVSGSALRS
ncbi:uncharacterized protein IUM83_10660 [Phytophthora cinnamomi]|uniref:uncharacterized protein n=1 Tax=Phytophthora cinnamomi TaxID=4785 RepID=UPI00355ABA0D|nr:hypothetical protein IUM83_10660 [Phytophthora cinnamomi]